MPRKLTPRQWSERAQAVLDRVQIECVSSPWKLIPGALFDELSDVLDKACSLGIGKEPEEGTR